MNRAHEHEKKVKHFFKLHRFPQRQNLETIKRAAEMRNRPCTYCGKDGGTVDHVIPLSRGGKDHWTNMVPCCEPCNSEKSNKLLGEWKGPDRGRY